MLRQYAARARKITHKVFINIKITTKMNVGYFKKTSRDFSGIYPLALNLPPKNLLYHFYLQ
jgi:hypothetical protein